MPFDPTRRHHPISLQQAAQEAPSLARLVALVRESADCLAIVTPLIPPGLRAVVKAGPIEAGTWCLLVQNNAAAAKLRQLLPALQAQLRVKRRPVNVIRIKVQAERR